jgi:hypothetical protein
MRGDLSHNALTIRYGELREELTSVAWICEGYDAVGPGALPEILEVVAIWDTGTTNTAISEALATRLNLSLRDVSFASHFGGRSRCNIYVVNISLPSGISVRGLEVLSGDTGNCDIFIGMDIIGRGDFAVSNFNGETVMSFRMPSVEVTDYEAKDGAKT